MNLKEGQTCWVIRPTGKGGSKLESLEFRGVEIIQGCINLVFHDPSCSAVVSMPAHQVSGVEVLQFEAQRNESS